MSRRDPLLPNAGIVARREYRERVRSRLFLVSTLVLAGIAAAVSLGPLALRLLDRGTITEIVVVAPDEALLARTMASLEGVLNLPPTGAEGADGDAAATPPRYSITAADDAATAIADVETGQVDGALVVERTAAGSLDFQFHTRGSAGSAETQLVGFGTLATAILDWQSDLPIDATNVFHPPSFQVVPTSVPTDGGRPIDPQAAASRSFLGIAFVVLIFITLVIYGMWVATGVAAEKSSRVMELMISAASPVQLLVGKVVGLGLAGLTQYVAILVPAIVILLIQDRLAVLALGPSGSGEPLVGLTLPLLGAFLLFFVLGFALYALIYAAAGSLVSRPEDLQVVALPLSLISMVGYLIAIAALGGASGTLVSIGSYVPFWSPFVMLGRLMVGRVEPWELGLSVALLVLGIAGALWIAIRVYSAGVLLYGQRPGLRAFVAAARGPG
jgi:ABC-2 type transport system permease protein